MRDNVAVDKSLKMSKIDMLMASSVKKYKKENNLAVSKDHFM